VSRGVTFAALVAAGAVALAGCGGEDASDETSAAPGGAAQTVEIRESEFALEPASVNLDSAGTYTFRAVNEGSVEHALELEGNGVEEETETIGRGESAELTVELAAGTYELYCPVDGHKDQGMVGSVVVGAGGGATTTGETETDEDDDGSNSGEGYGY
jgi:plastocyanin